MKCPQPAAHLQTLESGKINRDHMVQMMWQLACTGRKWCDYVSFNPDFPLRMQLFVKRVERDPAAIAELEKEIAKFVAELEAKLDKIKRR